MRTSYFYSPTHPSKVCDIAVETIIDTYYKKGISFHSDIFGLIQDGSINLYGNIKTTDIISDEELIPIIQSHIGTDYPIVNNIKISKVDEPLEERTFSGVYLGYACFENASLLPFEHDECRNLTKIIYDKLNIPIRVQIHINGEAAVVSLEHNYENKEELNTIVKEFFDRENIENAVQYNEPEIHHSEIRTDVVYKSNDSIVSSFYGPRAWYGETDYIGSDMLSNKRLAHLMCREYSIQYLKENALSYCGVEISYTDNNPRPINFGIKGNSEGIHLENGTFFEYGDVDNNYFWVKKIILEKLQKNELNIIDIAKWGFPSTNIL
jgi:S-adenosylmethionine synthetase